MRIRPYTTGDRLGCIEIFRSNVPAYFTAFDELAFVQFLNQVPGPFCVVDVDGLLGGCGGVAIDYPELNVATLCWGMVIARLHRRGFGRALLVHRMEMIASEYPAIRRMQINTTQKTRAFFELHGFLATHMEANGYGVGLDRVHMERELERLNRR